MAEKKLSPRQKMINMMYLVLTALLALNVSKEVLNSFFEVNQGITRTTSSFDAKNSDTYAAFDAAAELNEVKAGPFRRKAYQVKERADSLVIFIQEMKYNLVLKADKKVYLGSDSEIKDSLGKLIDEKATDSAWSSLSDYQRAMPIGELNAKDNRDASGTLFWSKKRSENISTELKENMIKYRDFLIASSEGNENLKASVRKVFKLEGNFGKEKDQSWEEYNFYDMPSVGALTLLSKMQSDVRNTEADVIGMLKENIEANSLKFTSAKGIQVAKSNFVLQGDEFSAEIFLAAEDKTQAPLIHVGEYDSLGGGRFEMRGTEGKDYLTVEVIDGKGMFTTKASSIGEKKWGGLITIKTKEGDKIYPFHGKYLVAAKGAVAAPTNMNVLYLGIDNPVQVSVAGYPPSQVTATTSNGTISTVNRAKGEYIIKPKRLTNTNTPIVSLFVTRDGKRTLMGRVDFKVKNVPDPIIMCGGKLDGTISRDELVAGQQLVAKMKDFPFDRKALSYGVISYDVVAYFKGNRRNIKTVKGQKFTKEVKDAIRTTASGQTVTFSNIKVKLRPPAVGPVVKKGSITFTIK